MVVPHRKLNGRHVSISKIFARSGYFWHRRVICGNIFCFFVDLAGGEKATRQQGKEATSGDRLVVRGDTNHGGQELEAA